MLRSSLSHQKLGSKTFFARYSSLHHVTRNDTQNTRPSLIPRASHLRFCKPSKTGGRNGLGTRLHYTLFALFGWSGNVTSNACFHYKHHMLGSKGLGMRLHYTYIHVRTWSFVSLSMAFSSCSMSAMAVAPSASNIRILSPRALRQPWR